MRILFLTHYFPPEVNAPASRVHEMSRYWVKKGHEVTVISSIPNCPNGIIYKGYQNRLHRQVEIIDGIRVIRVWTYIAANKGYIRRIINYISFMLTATLAGLTLEKHDIIIATSPQFFCGWAGALIAKFKKIPFILEVRDLWPDSIVAVGAITNRMIIAFLEKIERALYSTATHIVTVGRGYKRNLVAKGVDKNKITIISNGIDMQLFNSKNHPSEIRKRYNLDGSFVCGYVGTIGMACGLDVAVRAAQVLKDRGHNRIKFMLVGDGSELRHLKIRTQQCGLDNIVFTGKQPRDAIPAFLASVDVCLVHLKKTDIFKSVIPSKIFEAAIMKRPIILGVEGDAAELIREASAGICIEPENAEDLIMAVLKLMGNAQSRKRYGHSGFAYVVKHFDRKVLANKYLKLIQIILALH